MIPETAATAADFSSGVATRKRGRWCRIGWEWGGEAKQKLVEFGKVIDLGGSKWILMDMFD